MLKKSISKTLRKGKKHTGILRLNKKIVGRKNHLSESGRRVRAAIVLMDVYRTKEARARFSK